MKRAPLLALALALSCVSCASGSIPVDGIYGLVDFETTRHDAYVIADPDLTDAQKKRYLRTSDVLIDNVNAALPDDATPLEKTPRPAHLIEQPIAPGDG